ncbi:hypothetical protein BD414DRAFT_477911 [Trametes punicea]|nr:hypothetical protein BD414DRAFT_477911 [Trametes punicea]
MIGQAWRSVHPTRSARHAGGRCANGAPQVPLTLIQSSCATPPALSAHFPPRVRS